MSPPVLTVTVNPAVDVAVTVDYLVPDHKLTATDSRRDPGGGGINVSRVLGRLGVASRAWVAVGGATGDELVSRVRAEGVEVLDHRVEGDTLESFSLPDAVTVVDTKHAALAHVIDSPADVVKPSRRELASLLEWLPADLREVEVGARQVLDRGAVGALVVSLGADGALLVERDGPSTWYESADVAVVSTVGSGDAMVGGIVAGLTAGESMVDATRRGVAAGAATVLTPGTDLCHREDVDRLVDEVVVKS